MIDPIILKNHTVTMYPYLNRVVELDSRSKRFQISALHKPHQTPRSYTWECKLILNQKKTGSCVGNGIVHELAARPAPVKELTEQYAKYLYWEAQKIDPWPGGAYPDASPYYSGTSVLSGIKVAKKLGWFDEYRCALTLDDLILGVGHNGPSLIGINWYEGMMKLDANGFAHPTGNKVGGHCGILNAINIRKELFWFVNSWGINWGINGRCKISFKDIEKLFKNGEFWFFIRRHTIPKIR